jgi:gentisate 1,2-dioxygenase
MSPADVSEDAALAALNDELASLDLEGHWRLSGAVLADEPRPLASAHLWRWADIRRLLLRAGDIRALDGGAGRRTVRLCMPGLEQKWATRTIHASFQLVKPGETAEAHRHSLAALRFVVEGRGGYTTVEGEKFIMEPRDLVLTPQNTWHDHGNDSDEAMIWIDGHDAPLTLALNAAFFERFSAPVQPVVHDQQFMRRRTGALRPRGVVRRAEGHPYIYKWRDAQDSLEAMEPADWDPYDGFAIDYVDPVSGGSTLPTIACRLYRLPPSRSTLRQRETCNRIYHVVQGAGRTVAEAKTLEWHAGDTFVVPGWTWSEHLASKDAILFAMSDEPLMRATCLYRRERAGDNAPTTGAVGPGHA